MFPEVHIEVYKVDRCNLWDLLSNMLVKEKGREGGERNRGRKEKRDKVCVAQFC